MFRIAAVTDCLKIVILDETLMATGIIFRISFMEGRIEMLRTVDVFKEMDEGIRNNIAGLLEEVRVSKQQNIFKKGSQGDAMYIIASGEVRVHDGNHVLSRLSENDVFGEYSLIDDFERSASVTAEKPSILYRLSRSDFDGLVSQHARLTRGILKVLIQRMRYMNELEEKLSKSYVKISKQNRKIKKQRDSINDQKQKLEEQNYDLLSINEEKNHLISIVVHGLKNPLTSSKIMAGMLRNGPRPLSSEQKEYLEIIDHSLRRMDKMINQVLDVNVIDSKVVQLKIEPINLRDVVEQVLVNHRVIIDQRGLRLQTDLRNVFADLNEVYIFQVVDNLLSNAIKFSSPGSTIFLSAKKAGGMAQLTVRDEGVGIPKNEVEKIFDRYRVKKHHLKQEVPHPGLGLAIVKKYVTAMGGTVTCESEEGIGSTFLVKFPV